jgi:hypothetical protein
VYIPTAIAGLSTIVCILGANALNKKQQAAITSAYIFMENAFKEFREKSKVLFGEDADRQVVEAIAKDKYHEEDFKVEDEKDLYFEEFYNEYFSRTEEEVLQAEYHFNRNFALRGYASLGEFYEFLDLPHKPIGDALGWSLYAGEAFYGYSWIDFYHEMVTMDDGMECRIIRMPFLPTADYLDPDIETTYFEQQHDDPVSRKIQGVL